ncbi:hypothetical protein B0H11DRAFT_2054314 [Mycena galericulata]|nr:hypothetical protein B0H11DRAFT_2054314 [Mycena galericulata]
MLPEKPLSTLLQHAGTIFLILYPAPTVVLSFQVYRGRRSPFGGHLPLNPSLYTAKRPKHAQVTVLGFFCGQGSIITEFPATQTV